jgi:formyl-CoA transferase
VPRAANASGGGQPGTIVKCKGWETDPNAYLYFIAQAPVWKAICQVIGKEPGSPIPISPPPRRAAEIDAGVRGRREMDHPPRPSSRPWSCSTNMTFPAARSCRWKNLAQRAVAAQATGTVVEVDHPKRGKYLTVGNPIKMSDSPTEVKRSPLLGEHTDEVLMELGFGAAEVSELRLKKVI